MIPTNRREREEAIIKKKKVFRNGDTRRTARSDEIYPEGHTYKHSEREKRRRERESKQIPPSLQHTTTTIVIVIIKGAKKKKGSRLLR